MTENTSHPTEGMDPTQRTGTFTARATLRPGEPVTQLQAIFQQIAWHLQKATDDDRAYTIEIKITANLTVNPWDAKIGEHVHHDHFQPDPENENLVLEPPNSAERRVFQPTPQGYQRIE